MPLFLLAVFTIIYEKFFWKTKGEMRMKWKVTGYELLELYIDAESFDDAIAEARKINPNYNIGQIVEGGERNEK